MVVAVCDDKQIYLDRVKSIIDSYLHSKGIASSVITFHSGDELLRDLSLIKSFDLVILDVEMPDSDGLYVASKIREYHETVPIAFLSAFMKYSPSGYRVRAIRYMLKNDMDMDAQIQECLDCVIAEKAYSESSFTFDFNVGERTVKAIDILYLESCGNYTLLRFNNDTNNEELKVRGSLSKITSILSSVDFIQISAKQSVNLYHVKSILRYSAKMKDGKELSISQKKYNDVLKSFNLYRGRHL